MLAINQTVEFGLNTYNFVSRGTEYTVIDKADGLFNVFSNRLNSSYGQQIAVMTKKEMATRSKALRNLVALIEA